MQKHTQRHRTADTGLGTGTSAMYRSNIKVWSLSLAAIAVLAVGFGEQARVRGFINDGRSRISRMMLFHEANWEEIGASNLSARVSKEQLVRVSGLKDGQEMLQIDLGELESRLMAIPWLESVQIQKKLPSTISIRYTVHHAHALSLRKGKLWSISTFGHWIAPLERGEVLDLPVMINEESMAFEILWLDALETELGAHLLQIHEVGYQMANSRATAILELQYQSQALKISLVASGKPMQEQLTRLKQVVQYLIKNNILVSSVDLRLGKKVVVNVGKRP